MGLICFVLFLLLSQLINFMWICMLYAPWFCQWRTWFKFVAAKSQQNTTKWNQCAQFIVFVIWWCHQMETFSALLAICAGNSPVTSEFPAQKARDAELWCFLWSAPWINGWVNNREAGDLRRHRAHYDVTLMHAVDKSLRILLGYPLKSTGTEGSMVEYIHSTLPVWGSASNKFYIHR